MQFGVMNNPVNDLLSELEAAAKMGFDYMEITVDPPGAHYSTLLARRDEIADALESLNINVICHMPTFVSLADLSPHIRAASLTETMGAMEAAAAVGAKKITLHPAFINGMGRRAVPLAEELALESLDALAVKAQELKLQICLENLSPNFGYGDRPASLHKLLERRPDISMTLDLAHAFLWGGQTAIHTFFKTCGSRIKHTHISDNYGNTDEHLPLGCGGMDFVKIVQVMKQYGYDETITFEIFAKDRDYCKMSLAKFKDIWNN